MVLALRAARQVCELDVLNGARGRVACPRSSTPDLEGDLRIHVLVVAAARMRVENHHHSTRVQLRTVHSVVGDAVSPVFSGVWATATGAMTK